MAATFNWREVWILLTRADPIFEDRQSSELTGISHWASDDFVSEWSSLKAEVFSSQRDRREAISNDELILRLAALKSEIEATEPATRGQAISMGRCLHYVEKAIDQARKPS